MSDVCILLEVKINKLELQTLLFSLQITSLLFLDLKIELKI